MSNPAATTPIWSSSKAAVSTRPSRPSLRLSESWPRRANMDRTFMQRIDKPWGYELLWARTADYAGKVLHINRGHKLSLQYHEKKEETILLYSGKLLLAFEDDRGVLREITLSPGQNQHIPVRRK